MCVCYRISELERQLQEDRAEAEEKLEAQRVEYENRLGELEVELVKKKKEVGREGGGSREAGSDFVCVCAYVHACVCVFVCMCVARFNVSHALQEEMAVLEEKEGR